MHDCAVLASHRRKGVSMAMLEECERIAVELGCCKITLEVLDGNAPAKAAYEKFGFASYELDPAVGGAQCWQKKLG